MRNKIFQGGMTLILVETKLYRGKSWHATAESSMVELKIISKKVISYNGLNFIQFNLNNLWRKIRSKITSHLVHIIQLQREKLREITMYIESGINEMSCKTDQVLQWSIRTDFLLSYRSMLHSMMEYTPVIILILMTLQSLVQLYLNGKKEAELLKQS